mmetsp:Transcript_4153/g.8377  ORF Transcript_4153/g.8377 Transcript_4153/m.8377 type:complete len:398 (-) Transcript_4153:61-1254(-)
MDKRSPSSRPSEEKGAPGPLRSEAATQLEVALSLATVEQQIARQAATRTVPISMTSLQMESSQRGHDRSQLENVANLSGIYQLSANGPLGQANIQDPLRTPSFLYYDPMHPPYSQIHLPSSVQIQSYQTAANPMDPIHLAMLNGSIMMGNPSLTYPPIQSFSSQLPPGSRVLSVAMMPTAPGTTQTQVASFARLGQAAVPIDGTGITGTIGVNAPTTIYAAPQVAYTATVPKGVVILEPGTASLTPRTADALKQPSQDEQPLEEENLGPPRRKKRKYDHESFPEKLHRLIIEAAISRKDHIIRYTTDGTRFQILHTKLFEDEILPHYFRHNRISSFKRLLRMYGFRRVDGTWMQGTFEHPLFRRDNPGLCKRMERVSSGKGGKHERTKASETGANEG